MKLVLFSEWEALYDDDGTLLLENHTLSAIEVIRLLGGEVISANNKQEKECMDTGGAPPAWG